MTFPSSADREALQAEERVLHEKYGLIPGALISAAVTMEFLTSGVVSHEDASENLARIIEALFNLIVPAAHPGKKDEIKGEMERLLVKIFQYRFPGHNIEYVKEGEPGFEELAKAHTAANDDDAPPPGTPIH